MRASPVSFIIVLLFAASASAAVSPADIGRAIDMVFAGDNGDVAGDVNADGHSTAADVSGSVEGLRSPTQPGPYGVGIRRLTFTKESAAVAGQTRTLRTDIWYPGPPGSGPLPSLPGGLVNAPLAEGLSRLPMLMFSHGSCGFPSQSIALTPVFASYGFIVVAPPHPGNTIADLLLCNNSAAQAASFIERPEDIKFVIDEMLRLNEDSTSFFFDTIDPDRIGMSGHSFGGVTTYRVTSMDQRIVAGLALAPAAFGIEDEVRSIDVPVMVQGGTLDSVLEFEELIKPSFELLGPPRYLVEIANTGHYAFNDVCLGGPECAPGTLTQDEAALRVRRYAVPFLLHYIAGRGDFDAFLDQAAAPPGITLTADLE
jgi:predicted dienelactone hydrolase